MLIVVGGLPGVGKTTVARALAGRLAAVHLRIDTFEAALVRQGLVPGRTDVGPHGYALALAAAETCLAAGTDVVVDAVFPVAAARRPFRELAGRAGVPVHWVRLICSDPAEHRRRVEERVGDLPGHVVPDWHAVRRRDVDQWHERHTVVDTATGDPPAAVEAALRTPEAVVRAHVAALSPRLAVRSLVARRDVVAAELTETLVVGGRTEVVPLSGWYRVCDGRVAAATVYREGSVEVG